MIIQSAPVVTRGAINICGWIIIAGALILTLIGIILVAVGFSHASTCTSDYNACWAACPYNSYQNTCYDACWDTETDCAAAAAKLIIGGFIILVIGLIKSCMACCVACGNFGRTPVMTGGGTTVVGMQPNMMMQPQGMMMQPQQGMVGQQQQQFPMYADPNQQQQQQMQQPQQPVYTQ